MPLSSSSLDRRIPEALSTPLQRSLAVEAPGWFRFGVDSGRHVTDGRRLRVRLTEFALCVSYCASVAMLSNFGPGVLANFGPPPVPQPTVTLMDQGAFCGLESQSGFVRAAPS